MKTAVVSFGLILALVAAPSFANEIVFQFNSPSFNGQGWSSHVLTIHNQELSRKLAIAAEKKAEELRAENEAKNTTQAKFISNLESRIYNELARQITEKLFEGVGTQITGNFAFNGGNISYTSDGQEIKLNITDSSGNITTVTVPIGDFGWIKP
jgi:hypothetical protein